MEKLRTKQLVMGFGHRVYRKGDPRSDIIKGWAKTLNQKFKGKLNEPDYFAIAERIDSVMKSTKS